MKQIIIILVLLFLGYFFLQTFFRVMRNVNTMAHVLTCENELKDIWQHIDQYREDWDGTFPQSLSQIYTQDEIPKCFGSSQEYCYLALVEKRIRPLCWDSETHCHKFDHKPYKRNVLFSDGHIESLYEKDFFKTRSADCDDGLDARRNGGRRKAQHPRHLR